MSNFGQRVRQMREEKGLTQQQLVARIKARWPKARLTQQSLDLIERGSSARSGYAVEIALTLGVTSEWLVTGEGKQFMADMRELDPVEARVLEVLRPFNKEQKVATIRFLDQITQPAPNNDKPQQSGTRRRTR